MKATEVFEEGLQIPPMKLVRAGVENEDLFRIMAENIRDPDQVLGDVRSLIAANETGGRRLVSFMEEYGLFDLAALAEVVQSRSERAMREAIRALPDGVYTSVSYTHLDVYKRQPAARARRRLAAFGSRKTNMIVRFGGAKRMFVG